MKYTRFTLVSLFSFALAWVSSIAQADMIIESTRIIYPETKREVSFKVSNVNKERATFIQMWLDDGNAAIAPEDAVTPFNLTPPVAKLKADSSQMVRLVFTGEPLPADRESVFYFNMLEIPQKSNEESKISFAVRTRIKVFYRPKALKGELTEHMDKVTWKLIKKDGNWVAEANNPSAFHLSFFSLNLGSGGKLDVTTEGGMIPLKQPPTLWWARWTKSPNPLVLSKWNLSTTTVV